MKILYTVAPFLAALIPALNPIAIFFCSGRKIALSLLGSSGYYQHSLFYLRSFNGGIGSRLRRQNGSCQQQHIDMFLV